MTKRTAAALAIALAASLAAPGVPAQKQKKPPPPPPLEGTTYDYDYDGKVDGHPERRWLGRVFVPKKAAEKAASPLPVLVFLHGTNAEKIKYRWMGGGQEGDVRRIVSEMIDSGQVPPMLVAAPSSIDPNTIVNAGLSWPAFDLDNFLDRTTERLAGTAVIDRARVIVAAHSGGACNIRGGLASALRARNTPVLAGFSIDTCMLFDLAKELAHARPSMHVVVTWQTLSWDREFSGFRTYFTREMKKAPSPDPGVLRELYQESQPGPMAHDAMVGITLRKYLPRVLGQTPPAPDAGAPPLGNGG